MGIFTDEYGELVTWRVALAGAVAVAIAIAVAVLAFGPKQREQVEEPTETSVPIIPPETKEERDEALAAWLDATEGSDLLSDLSDEEKRAIMEAAASFSDEGSIASIPAAPHRENGVLTAYLRIETEGKALYLTLKHEGNAPWEVNELREVIPSVNDQDMTPMPISDPDALAQIMPADVAKEVSRQFLASGIDGANEAWTTTKGTSTEGDVTRFQIRVPGRDGSEVTTFDASYDKAFGMLELYPVSAEAKEVR